MNFIYKNDQKIKQELQALENVKLYFQNVCDKFTALNLLEPEQELNLSSLFENPKYYVLEIATKGEVLKMGNIEISKTKAFEMLELPESVKEFITEIVSDTERRKHYVQQVHNVEVKKGVVNFATSLIDEIHQRHSVYTDTKDKQKAWELMQSISNSLNELRTISRKSNISLDMEDMENAFNFPDTYHQVKPDFENKANANFINFIKS
jgi:hypothetical protein